MQKNKVTPAHQTNTAYSSRLKPTRITSGRNTSPVVSKTLVLTLAITAKEFLGDDRVLYQPSRSELANSVAKVVRPNDLVVTLGAGDITTLYWEIKEHQSAKE